MTAMGGWAIVGSALMIAGAMRSTADDSKGPLDLLRSRGLVRYGSETTLTAKSENDLVRRIKELQPLQKVLLAELREQSILESRLKQLEKTRAGLLERRIALSRELRNARSAAENNRIVAALNEATDQVNLIDAETKAGNGAIDRQREAAGKARNEYLRVVGELRDAASRIDKFYEAIANDAEAQSALKQLGGDEGKELKVAASRGYLAAIKQLEKYEKAVNADSIPLTKRDGVYHLQAVLNDSQTIEMVLDTGASMVTLPAAVAEKVGLRPTAADANITVVIGDGSRIQAKVMRLQSIRIGKCKADDIECVVMPATLANAPALIGGSFLKHFTHRIDPDASQLTLARIDAGPPPKESAPAKKARPARPRPKKRGVQ